MSFLRNLKLLFNLSKFDNFCSERQFAKSESKAATADRRKRRGKRTIASRKQPITSQVSLISLSIVLIISTNYKSGKVSGCKQF